MSLPFCPPPWVRRRSRRPQTANPPAEVQRKTSRPLGANTLTQFASPDQPVPKKPLARFASSSCPMPRKRKRHRLRGASPFCGYVSRSAAAVAAITAAAAGIITTGTAGTAAAAALTAAYPDQDDQMMIHHQEFSPQKPLEEHILSFPPIKDFITFYGKRPKVVTHSPFSIFNSRFSPIRRPCADR